MRKLVFISVVVTLTLLTLLPIEMQSAVIIINPKFVNVTTAGTLSSLLTEDEKNNVTHLYVNGKLNGSDIVVLQDMANASMSVLDMSEANIVAGGSAYYTSSAGLEYKTSNSIIGTYMFYGSKTLESVSLPNTLEGITGGAFQFCPKLRSLTIGPDLCSIIGGLCCGTPLDRIILDEENTSFILENGVLYDINKTTVCKAITSIEGEVILPTTVSNILSYSFEEAELRSISIPTAVSKIENCTFRNCKNLEEVIFSTSLTNIDYLSFYGCDNLKTIDLSNTKVSKINTAFNGCSAIEELSLPSTLKEITGSSITSTALKKITCLATTPPSLVDDTYHSFPYSSIASLCKVYVPKGRVNTYKAATGWKRFSYIYEIGSTPEDNITPTPGSEEINGIYYLFDDATLTATVTYRGTITGSGMSTQYDLDFQYYKGDIVIPSTVTRNGKTYTVKFIGRHAFYQSTLLKSVKMPNTVTEISLSAFNGCTGLASVVFGNGLEKIQNAAFWGCSSLTNFVLPTTLTLLDSYAFYQCSSITRVVIPNQVTYLSSGTFSRCTSLQEVVLPESLKSLFGSVFYECKALSTIAIPGNVETIAHDTFYGCTSLTDINVAPSNAVYCSVDGVLYDKAVTHLYTCPEGKEGRYDIPSTVQEIGEHGDIFGAFCNCAKLTEVHIPNSVTFIGWMAFSGCTALQKVVSYIMEPFEFGENAFSTWMNGSYVFSTATLYVPKGTKAKYLATSAWNKFKIIEEMDEAPGELANLQEFINAHAGAAGVVDVDLSKFYDVVRDVTLNVSTGVSYRFMNGTLSRAETLDSPVVLISNGSKVEIADGAVVTGTGVYCSHETIRMEGGVLNITHGVVEGTLWYPPAYIGDPWQSNALLLTSSSDHFYLYEGEVYGGIGCSAVGADVRFDKGKLFGFGLRDTNATQNGPRRATPVGSRAPHINTSSDIFINATTSQDYTWGWFDTAQGENSPFEITLKGQSVLHLEKKYDKGFYFHLDDKKNGDVIVVGENHTITQDEVNDMTFAPISYQTSEGWKDRDAYLELKNNKVYLRYEDDELPNTGCDEEWLQQRLDQIAAQKPSEPVELTICEDGITLTKGILVAPECKVILTGGPITSEAFINYRYGGEGVVMVYGEIAFHDISLTFNNNAKNDGCTGYLWSGGGTVKLLSGTNIYTSDGIVVGGWGQLDINDAYLMAGGEEPVIASGLNTTISDFVHMLGMKTYCNGKISVDAKNDPATGSTSYPIMPMQVQVTSSLDLLAPKNILRNVYLYQDAAVKTYHSGFMSLSVDGEWGKMALGRAFITSPSITQEDYSRMSFSGMPVNRFAEFEPSNHQVRLMSIGQQNIQPSLNYLSSVDPTVPIVVYMGTDAVNMVYQSATISHQNITFDGMQGGNTSRGRLHFTKNQTITLTTGSRLTLTNIDVTGEGGNEGFVVNGKIVIGGNVHVSDLPCFLHVGSGGSVLASGQLMTTFNLLFVSGLANGQTVVAGDDGYVLTEDDLLFVQVDGCELQLDKANNRIIAVNVTGIEGVIADQHTDISTGLYDLSGRRVASPRQGVYIVRDHGKTRKVNVK